MPIEPDRKRPSPSDEELAEYAAALAERLNLLPGCPNGHVWETIDDVYMNKNSVACRECNRDAVAKSQGRRREQRKLDRARARGEAAGMTGKLRCMECGHPIRDHGHVWCDLPVLQGWVPGDEMRKRESRIRSRRTRERLRNQQDSSI